MLSVLSNLQSEKLLRRLSGHSCTPGVEQLWIPTGRDTKYVPRQTLKAQLLQSERSHHFATKATLLEIGKTFLSYSELSKQNGNTNFSWKGCSCGRKGKKVRMIWPASYLATVLLDWIKKRASLKPHDGPTWPVSGSMNFPVQSTSSVYLPNMCEVTAVPTTNSWIAVTPYLVSGDILKLDQQSLSFTEINIQLKRPYS